MEEKPEGAGRSMEVFINEQRADLQVLQMIVQILLMRLLGTQSQQGALAAVEDMEGTIEAALAAPTSNHETQLMRQMMRFRAQEFFQSFRNGMGLPPRKTGGSAPAN